MNGLEPKLFVFLLSTFLGLEVIRRVSPLLHTPLMSLTNAISAIAVVAAIQVMAEGEHYRPSSRCSARWASSRPRPISSADSGSPTACSKCSAGRRRIVNSLRSIVGLLAADQLTRPRPMSPIAGSVHGSYLVAAALFILSLKWLSHPAHCPPRRAGRRNRHGHGRHRHAA